MREILFRGKSTGNGEWVYGVAFPHDNCGKVTMFRQNQGDGALEGLEVLPETVGQYTGLTDRNGKKIFEGDIVKFPHGTKSMNGKIEYIEEDCIYYLTYKTGRVPFGVFFNGFELEIIGNIHDNPELLEVTE